MAGEGRPGRNGTRPLPRAQGGTTLSTNRRRRRPGLEGLESRQTPSATPAAPAVDTIAILEAFTQAYPSRIGEPKYNPVFDLNHNGQVGQDDGRILLHILPPVSPRIPLQLRVSLAPGDFARGHVPQNSGGVTHNRQPTIVGHTTPGSLIFTGTGRTDLRLKGPAVVADAQGNFALAVTNVDGINQFDFLAVDPYGRQTLRAYPIYWLGYAAYQAAHPTRK